MIYAAWSYGVKGRRLTDRHALELRISRIARRRVLLGAVIRAVKSNPRRLPGCPLVARSAIQDRCETPEPTSDRGD